MKRRAVFLDRDGVINRAYLKSGVSVPPASIDQLEILPGVPEACRMLRSAGFLLIVVTNQPDVARGSQTKETIGAIHSKIRTLLPIDAIKTCYHDNADMCSCRKPKPGMLLEAAEEFEIDVNASYMVGDRLTDIEAGVRAGCKTILIGKDAADLREAAEQILSDTTHDFKF